jgi:putative transposase
VKTYLRWIKKSILTDKRTTVNKNPSNKLTISERQHISSVVNSAEYANLPPCQIVPKLADKGIYIASESTFYRILRANGQLSHRGHSRARKHNKPRELVASKPNQVCCWDITYLPTRVRGVYLYLYMVIDIYSRKIIGYEISDVERSDIAKELFIRLCIKEKISPDTLCLHSDNGAPMKGSALVVTLNALGVMKSYSRPGVSDDNPFIESLFKTVKYCPKYPKAFDNINSAKKWVEIFVSWYNDEHMHSGINFVTPTTRHTGLDASILANRVKVYQAARANNPQRWSRNCRNWSIAGSVLLNPSKNTLLTAA